MQEQIEKGRRGRKPKGDEIYIKESIRQIAIYEQELDAQDNEHGSSKNGGGDAACYDDSSKRKSKLYAKMSALKSRVKRKQEQMFQRQSVNEFNNRFKKLAKIIADELTCSCRDNTEMSLMMNKKGDSKDQAGAPAAPTSG